MSLIDLLFGRTPEPKDVPAELAWYEVCDRDEKKYLVRAYGLEHALGKIPGDVKDDLVGATAVRADSIPCGSYPAGQELWVVKFLDDDFNVSYEVCKKGTMFVHPSSRSCKILPHVVIL